MPSLSKLAIVLGAIVIFTGCVVSDTRAQKPPAQVRTGSPANAAPASAAPAIDESVFAKAKQLEAEGKNQDALKEYSRIVHDNSRSNPELAAEALYRGGLYASSDRYSQLPSQREQGQDVAVQLWKQLVNEYPNTRAAQRLEKDGRLQAVQAQIIKRNSKDLRFQILDFLVRLTRPFAGAYSYAIGLILLAILVKLITLPLTIKQYKGMREMQRMQPLIKELQAKYKGEELARKQMELFKEHGVNPLASCFPTLVQLPFLILVFTAIRLYEFAFANGKFLWIGSPLAKQYPGIVGANLASPDIPLLALYALSNYVTMRMTPATDPQQQQTQNTMALMTSGIFFYMFISQRWSSAFVLYWFVLNLLSIWQQYEYVYKPHKARLAGGEGPTGMTANGVGLSANGASGGGSYDRPLGSATPPTRVKPRKKRK